MCIEKKFKKQYYHYFFTTIPITVKVSFELIRPDAEARRLRQIYREERDE